MKYQITHIRLSNTGFESNEKITDVKLSNFEVKTIHQVIVSLEVGNEYYYTNVDGSTAYVEAVFPSSGTPYIRTKANYTTKDNLLSLPRF